MADIDFSPVMIPTSDDKLLVMRTDENNDPTEAGNYSVQTLIDTLGQDAVNAKNAAESAASEAAASAVLAQDAAAQVRATGFYGLRRRSDGQFSRTGLAANMTATRSNGTFNPVVSDFKLVRPWSDITLCLYDNYNTIVSMWGDDNFSTYAALTGDDGLSAYNWGTLFAPYYQRLWQGTDENGFAFKEWDVSAVKLPGFSLHPAFRRADGSTRPFIIVNSFKTGLDPAGKVVSKPNVQPLVNMSLLNFDSKYAADTEGKWTGEHFTTVDVWRTLAIIEFGTTDLQATVGNGIISGMPYNSGETYQLTAPTEAGNTVTLSDSGQPFYVGMVVNVGTSYTNQTYAAYRKITAVDTSSGSLVITLDGEPFTAPIGAFCCSWGQPDSADNLLQLGTSCGWIEQWGSQNRSHVYLYGLFDPWGNLYEWERGILRKNLHWWVNFDILTSLGVSDPEANGHFTDIGLYSFSGNGWIADFDFVTFNDMQMQVPSAIGANSIGDYIYYLTDDYGGIRACIRGGHWHSGFGAGAFYEVWDGSPSNTNINRSDRNILNASRHIPSAR